MIHEGYRVIRHPLYEGMRGEYELQWLAPSGDFQNVAFSHDQEELLIIAQNCGDGDTMNCH